MGLCNMTHAHDTCISQSYCKRKISHLQKLFRKGGVTCKNYPDKGIPHQPAATMQNIPPNVGATELFLTITKRPATRSTPLHASDFGTICDAI